MKRLLILAFGLLCATAPQPDDRSTGAAPSQPSQQITVPELPKPDTASMKIATVSRVAQADIIVVSIDGKEQTIRLWGIDAPARATTSDRGDPFGDEAHSFVSNLLSGERVWVKIHEDADYDRSHLDRLADVYRHPDGLFVNAETVRQGYAKLDHANPHRLSSHLEALQSRAMLAAKGLWGHKAKPKDATGTQPPSIPAAAPATKPAALTPSDPKPSASPSGGRPGGAVEPATISVYKTRTGTKYHRAGCSYTNKGAIPINLQDAKAAGLSPCSRCNPPS